MLRRTIVCLLILVVLLGGISTAAVRAEVSDADIQKAAQDIARAQASADAAAARVERLRAEIEEASYRVEQAEEEVATLAARKDELQAGVRERAIAAYKSASEAPFLHILNTASAKDVTEYERRLDYMDSVVEADAKKVRELEDIGAELDAKQAFLVDERERLETARSRAEAATQDLLRRLDQAQAVKQQLVEQKAREEAERRARELERQRRLAAEKAAREAAERAAAAARAAASSGGGGSSAPRPAPISRATSAGIPTGGLACPVSGRTSFIDSWGYPRSGGRRHKGVDMFASHGTPLVAISSGRIGRVGYVGLGGLRIWLHGDNGISYYYAHNSKNVVSPGQRVSAGQLIGYVGKTGNARTTPPHVHFEVHPGNRSAVNPYPHVAAVC